MLYLTCTKPVVLIDFRSISIDACEAKSYYKQIFPMRNSFFSSTSLPANAAVLYLKMKGCLYVLASA